jgi:hypothetical protein
MSGIAYWFDLRRLRHDEAPVLGPWSLSITLALLAWTHVAAAVAPGLRRLASRCSILHITDAESSGNGPISSLWSDS